MNQFPQFQANAPALPQLSATRMNMLSDGIRANQIKSGIGYRVSQTPGGTTLAIAKNRYGQMRFKHPFTLSVEYDGTDWAWTVSSYQSSVTDGTNGDVIDLSTAGFDTPTAIAATKYIALQASVSSGLELSSWTLLEVDLADSDEVGYPAIADPPPDPPDPVIQSEARLLIGKITYTAATEEAPATAVATQAIYTAQRVAHSFLNGSVVRTFEAAPVHPSYL